MSWNANIQAEYIALLAGPMGAAFSTDPITHIRLISKLKEIETGAPGSWDPVPVGGSYLTYAEAIELWVTRAAWAFWMERLKFWPWRLRDKSVELLCPLLNFYWQGLIRCPTRTGESVYAMHGVWDVDPAARVTEAILAAIFYALSGNSLRDEQQVVENIFIGMRNKRWGHTHANYEEYEGRTQRGEWVTPTFEFKDVSEVRRGECHIISNYIVLLLRAFNIPVHIGQGWGDSCDHWDFDRVHSDGHCFIYFPSIGKWLSHGDDVHSGYLSTIPPSFALRSEHWMRVNQLAPNTGLDHYSTTKVKLYEDITNWCVLLGQSPDLLYYDIPHLYTTDTLRPRLRNIAVNENFAALIGAPDPVPPLFDDTYIDALLAWIGAKLEKASAQE